MRTLAIYLWSVLGDTPVDEYDQIDTPFLMFEKGTEKEYIWHWFEDTFNLSIGELSK